MEKQTWLFSATQFVTLMISYNELVIAHQCYEPKVIFGYDYEQPIIRIAYIHVLAYSYYVLNISV